MPNAGGVLTIRLIPMAVKTGGSDRGAYSKRGNALARPYKAQIPLRPLLGK